LIGIGTVTNGKCRYIVTGGCWGRCGAAGGGAAGGGAAGGDATGWGDTCSTGGGTYRGAGRVGARRAGAAGGGLTVVCGADCCTGDGAGAGAATSDGLGAGAGGGAGFGAGSCACGGLLGGGAGSWTPGVATLTPEW
jgi:hypothetical protein